MKITKVQGHKIEKEGSNVKGVVEITLDDCFVVKDIRIIEKEDKIVVAMPSKTVNVKDENGNLTEEKVHKDLAHPINSETREYFNKTILDAFNEAEGTNFSKDI